MIQAAFHFGYLISLFAVGFIADHYGAKRAYLVTGIAEFDRVLGGGLVPGAVILLGDTNEWRSGERSALRMFDPHLCDVDMAIASFPSRFAARIPAASVQKVSASGRRSAQAPYSSRRNHHV